MLVAEILNAIEKSHEERIEQLMEIILVSREFGITCLSSMTSLISMTVAFRRSCGRLVTRCFYSIEDRRRSGPEQDTATSKHAAEMLMEDMEVMGQLA